MALDPFGNKGPQDVGGAPGYSPGHQLFDPSLYAGGGGHSAESNIVAKAGGGQANATRLKASINRISACATAGDSVALPPATGGQMMVVVNAGAAAAQIYGAGGTRDTINGVAGTAGIALAAASSTMFTSSAAGFWTSVSGVGGAGEAAGVSSWNARTGDVTQTAGDVTAALGYAPHSAMGVTDGSNALPGQIGEFISASVQAGSAIAAVSNVAIDITTMVLTAGDWDLLGQVGTQAASGGHIQHMQVWMNTVSVTLPAVFAGAFHEVGGIATGGTEQMVLPTGRLRMNVTANTTVYLTTRIQFTGSLSCYGFMSARRVR